MTGAELADRLVRALREPPAVRAVEELVREHPVAILTAVERLIPLPRPEADEGAGPCGREGCGHTMACCRPDCPIEMMTGEPHWTWRRRAALAAAQEG